MYTNFNLTLLDVLTIIMKKHLFFGIYLDDDTYAIDPSTVALHESGMTGKSVFTDGMILTIPYLAITAIEGIDVEPDVDEYGIPCGVDVTPIIRYCKISDKPLKFNKVRI